jgi:hypothetical protein
VPMIATQRPRAAGSAGETGRAGRPCHAG